MPRNTLTMGIWDLPASEKGYGIYCWCEELISIKFCAEEMGIADKTVIDWNNYMREICALEMDEKERKQIGDEGLIVEIDKSLFVKRKYNTHTYTHLESYLIEFMLRQAQAVDGEDGFQSVLKAIAKRFPPKK